jgi:phage gp29-like protein
MLRKIKRFEDFQYDLTDAVGKGIAAHEIKWRTGAEWVPDEFMWVPQPKLQVERTTGEIQYLNMGIAEPLLPMKWVVHEHRAKSGYIEQAALFRVLAWTYAYKAYNSRDMQRFLELYGLPLRLGKYPAGIGDKARNELLRAVRAIGNDGAGVVPANMSIDFIAAAPGKVDDFLSVVAYWEKKQSMAILGGTLTSQADAKSNTHALGMIHDKARREIMLHDVCQIDPTMDNQVVKPIALINGMFPEDRMPSFVHETSESVDQQAMVNVLSTGAAIGMEIDIDWAHKAMQIPRADKGAQILKGGAKPPLQTDGTAAADAALTRLVALARKADETPEAYSVRLAALGATQEEALIQQVAALVAENGGFDGAIEGIEALVTTTPSADWVQVIARGMAAANLAGRSNAS